MSFLHRKDISGKKKKVLILGNTLKFHFLRLKKVVKVSGELIVLISTQK